MMKCCALILQVLQALRQLLVPRDHLASEKLVDLRDRVRPPQENRVHIPVRILLAAEAPHRMRLETDARLLVRHRRHARHPEPAAVLERLVQHRVEIRPAQDPPRRLARAVVESVRLVALQVIRRLPREPLRTRRRDPRRMETRQRRQTIDQRRVIQLVRHVRPRAALQRRDVPLARHPQVRHLLPLPVPRSAVGKHVVPACQDRFRVFHGSDRVGDKMK